MYIVVNEYQQDTQNIFNMCIYSVIVCIFNCLYTISQWKHLVSITVPGGLRRGQQMRAAWCVCGLLCGGTWESGSSSAKILSTYQSHTRSNYAAVMSSFIQWANKVTKPAESKTRTSEHQAGGNTRAEDEVQAPTFEGDEDAGCGQRVVDHRVPESEAGQCQEGVDRPQTVQLHGRPTSSSTRRAFQNNFCRDKWRKKQMWEGALSTWHCKKKKKKPTTSSLFSFINLCDMSDDWLPGAPSLRVLATQHGGVEITPRSLGAPQNWWVRMERSQALRDVYTLPFGKNYVCFSECVPAWQNDGTIRLSRVREAFLLLPSTHPKHIPVSWHYTYLLLCNYRFT